MPRSSLAAEFWGDVQDELERRSVATFKFLVRELMTNGYPPGSKPVPEHQEYLRLSELKLKGDPMYHGSAAAKPRLAELEMRYGPVPEVPTMGVM